MDGLRTIGCETQHGGRIEDAASPMAGTSVRSDTSLALPAAALRALRDRLQRLAVPKRAQVLATGAPPFRSNLATAAPGASGIVGSERWSELPGTRRGAITAFGFDPIDDPGLQPGSARAQSTMRYGWLDAARVTSLARTTAMNLRQRWSIRLRARFGGPDDAAKLRRRRIRPKGEPPT